MRTQTKYSLILLTLLIVLTCSSPEKQLSKAIQEKSIEKLTQFIEKFPDSELVPKAKAKIAEIKFTEAQKINTVESYENFLKEIPNSNYTALAKKSLEKSTIERDTYEAIKKQNTVKSIIRSIEKYITIFPKGPYNQIAQADLKGLSTISNHVVISSTYIDKRKKEKATDFVSRHLKSYDDWNIASNLYTSLKKKLNYWNNKNFKCFVSGAGNKSIQKIQSKIPEKYIWINTEIAHYTDKIVVQISTPGAITTWSDKEVTVKNSELETLMAIELPPFEVTERQTNPADKLFSQNFVSALDFLENSDEHF